MVSAGIFGMYSFIEKYEELCFPFHKGDNSCPINILIIKQKFYDKFLSAIRIRMDWWPREKMMIC